MATTHNADDTDDAQNESTDRRTAEELAEVGVVIDQADDVHSEAVQRLGDVLAERDDGTVRLTGYRSMSDELVNVKCDGLTVHDFTLERHGLEFAAVYGVDDSLELRAIRDTEGDR